MNYINLIHNCVILSVYKKITLRWLKKHSPYWIEEKMATGL
jgi:hypothetical protein